MTIQAARGRRDEALRVYDAALSKAGLTPQGRKLLLEGKAAAERR